MREALDQLNRWPLGKTHATLLGTLHTGSVGLIEYVVTEQETQATLLGSYTLALPANLRPLRTPHIRWRNQWQLGPLTPSSRSSVYFRYTIQRNFFTHQECFPVVTTNHDSMRMSGERGPNRTNDTSTYEASTLHPPPFLFHSHNEFEHHLTILRSQAS